MLIIVLMKGVPARTTKVVTVGGVLNREEMDIVLNPHDAKAVEAADFVKRRIGGKAVALSMGPDQKLAPIMKPLFDSEVYGIDEECILSDRAMAGSDTLATSYAVSMGVRKVLERHSRPIEEMADAIRRYGYSEATRAKAVELYRANLLPNRVFCELPAVKDTIVGRFLDDRATAEETTRLLEEEKARLSKFIMVSGVKTTDGETGSVGPQVAEAVSELLGRTVPHATYVEDFDVDPATLLVESERKMGYLSQRLEMELPALLTISEDYRPRPPGAGAQYEARLNNYRGKVLQPIKWNAAELGADPKRLGFAGSPTIVGPGVDIGRPPVQKVVGKSVVFTESAAEAEFNGRKFGPFERGDLADGLPDGFLAATSLSGKVATFSYEMLAEELFR